MNANETVSGNSGCQYRIEKGGFVKSANGGLVAHILRRQAAWWKEYGELLYPVFPRLLWTRIEHPYVEVATEWLEEYSPLNESMCSRKYAETYSNVMDWVTHQMHPRFRSARNEWWRPLVAQTLSRIRQVDRHSGLASLIHKQRVVINGRPMLGLRHALSKMEHMIHPPKTEFVLCHGDLHAGNILLGPRGFRLVDPRGGFIGGGSLFAPYYDWGKILHDLWGDYGNIIARGCACYSIKEGEYLITASDGYTDKSLALHAVLDRLHDEEKFFAAAASALLMSGLLPFHAANPWVRSLAASAVWCCNSVLSGNRISLHPLGLVGRRSSAHMSSQRGDRRRE